MTLHIALPPMSERYPAPPDSLLALEEEVLERWREEGLFERTLEATAHGEPFVFYEGPPTANGRPGLHHIISRTIKDLICRHRTMKGHRVTRIAGWDTHGLPVEIEAENRLGISGKPEIEELGIARFNEACRDSVFTYKEEWERLSERIGYWLDYSRPYVTFHPEYIESVWWILSELAQRGLLYRGHKIVPYCPRCGTGLSSHEVAQGYEEVADPSLYATVELLDGSGRRLVLWTTTPWTLVSNVALAVNPELEYVAVEHEGQRLILARSRVEALFGEDVRVVERVDPGALVGARYRRPLDLIPEEEVEGRAWEVIPADFVSDEDGSGIVHLAPAFGADDFQAGQDHGLAVLRPVLDDGTFRRDLPLVGGRFVKEADDDLVEELRRRGAVLRHSREVHSYPHCWRCSSPLVYLARDSWFAATSTLKEEMLANNGSVGWHPPEVGEGRMGEWLANNVDWALSRDRFWGTPLPVWICDGECERTEWIGSFRELEERAGPLPDGFDPHRPFIDELTWPCAECGGAMRRTPEVVDVWFDSGAMPFAQWHYPHENEEEWAEHFPADFICEGLDQTRGWFYSLLAISTMLGLGPAYRNVVVNGLILDADGLKMSKSRGNVVDPWDAIAAFGSDPLRWYLITSSNPWVHKRYDPDGVNEAARRFFDTLLNTYRFFALYAGIEGWEPGGEDPPPEERALLDRWLLSRLHGLVEEVGSELDGYQVTRAYRLVADFVDEDLSNWYVRRSRPRFWGNTDRSDALAAFRTLHEALSTVALLVAPVTPFFGDWLHRALQGGSAHLARFPRGLPGERDEALEREMEAARMLSTLGRACREEVKIRVRQPLRTLHGVVPGGVVLRDGVLDILKDELNVKEIDILSSGHGLVRLTARPNYARLGPRFQKETETVAAAIRALPEAELERHREGKRIVVTLKGEEHELAADDLEVQEEAAGELVVKSGGGFTAALDPELDEELRSEGLARELVNRIQRLRREEGLEVTDRIRLVVWGPGEIREAAERHRDFIAGETLAEELTVAELGDGPGAGAREVRIEGVRVGLRLEPC